MLHEMRIHGLGVIHDATVELGPGLTVITGETGAGKTMVVSSLGLLLGGKADPSQVRHDHDTASVEGLWDVKGTPEVAERITEAGADLDDGIATVVRTVAAAGRSRAFIGGRSVPTAVLTDIAGDLVAVHGQNDQLRLKSAAAQREALDRYAAEAVAKPLIEYRQCWRQLQQIDAELTELTTQAQRRAQEAELLRLGVAEVERIDPQPGEDEHLKAESVRLTHAEELRVAAATAHTWLAGDDTVSDAAADAVSALAQAQRALDAVREHDAGLGELADRIAEVSAIVLDIATSTAAYAHDVDADPARLASVEERRAALSGLTRAYGPTVDAVLEWSKQASTRLLSLDNDDDRIENLRAQQQSLRSQAAELAAQVSAARVDAAQGLAAAVTVEVQGLSMPNAQVQVLVQQHPAEGESTLVVPLNGAPTSVAATSDGIDTIDFTFVANPGAPARPLAAGASGGELSRVMLGLEVVLAAADPVPTFVFDEVDAGVGGSAGLGIGRRLASLGRHSQVLVVTHLAQVAAYADTHLVVHKSHDGQVTESGVQHLDDAQRVGELARMLAGMADSGTAQAHAAELLATARAEKRPATVV